MSKKSDFKICQGLYIDTETQEETKCIVSQYCKRNYSNYTQEELLNLLGYKEKPKTITLHQPVDKLKVDGCRHYVGLDSSVYIMSYEKVSKHL